MGKLSDWTSDRRLVRAFRPAASAGDLDPSVWPATVPAAARWAELAVVESWRTFLGSPERFLHYLLRDDPDDPDDSDDE